MESAHTFIHWIRPLGGRDRGATARPEFRGLVPSLGGFWPRICPGLSAQGCRVASLCRCSWGRTHFRLRSSSSSSASKTSGACPKPTTTYNIINSTSNSACDTNQQSNCRPSLPTNAYNHHRATHIYHHYGRRRLNADPHHYRHSAHTLHIRNSCWCRHYHPDWGFRNSCVCRGRPSASRLARVSARICFRAGDCFAGCRHCDWRIVVCASSTSK
ncbi:hypothetical protein BCR44DRAFT_1432436 [Catenaria anguillulae PL171]|uniref:Uncharacterized protein n=1 Tax=Catenaria anguillulae PL171 TaxID=765915 RepID=A0A1Y2HNY0_9FUNG|nr:hypothetical protein BCR44DRAFT_1432436 [Catenaria anguillulae PL171]